MRTLTAALAAALLAAASWAQPPGAPQAPDRLSSLNAEAVRAYAALQEARNELQGRVLSADAAKDRLREATDVAAQTDAQLRRALAVVADREVLARKARRDLEEYQGGRDVAGAAPAAPKGTGPVPAEDKLDRILKRLDDLDRRLSALERAAKGGKTGGK